MSVKQCAQGFRMINILKNFGIQDDNNILDGDDTYYNNYNKFSTFIEDAYKNCKVLGIPPAIIPSWIKDLKDCYSSFSNPSLNNNNIAFSMIDSDDKQNNDNDDKKTDFLYKKRRRRIRMWQIF